jgi:hypothetical protein
MSEFLKGFVTKGALRKRSGISSFRDPLTKAKGISDETSFNCYGSVARPLGCSLRTNRRAEHQSKRALAVRNVAKSTGWFRYDGTGSCHALLSAKFRNE